MVSEGLKYVVEGKLISLTSVTGDNGGSAGRLLVFYRLRKTLREKVVVVQVKPLAFERPVFGPPSGSTVGENDLDALLETAAEEIARRAVRDIPADMTAARG